MADHSDPTFRSYKPGQALIYAQQRTSYPPAIYNHVLNYHAQVSGEFSQLLDIGCGPGNATRDMALHFEHAIGLDPGTEMIAAARNLGGHTRTGEPIRFEVSTAEELASAEGVKEGSVDMLISAMAVHWFDMPAFWEQAARVLKPGGTVALWTRASTYCHPSSPNYAELRRVSQKFERDTLLAVEKPGNRLSRDMYRDLPLPWDVDPAQTAFPRELFVRNEWDRDGIISDKEGGDFFGGSKEMTADQMEQRLGTASQVTRWREANPDLAGGAQDIVKRGVGEFREAMGDQKVVKIGHGTAILTFQKMR